ncbi:oligosaccharide repeat unit polymerase [Pseudomonas entomophila]|uniref:oligosaccharide repeat unit polymerase n=1 Tax=Pseudomonas entomophila TaxID=312306 RepID=UPI002406C1FF|nr:oligosaccharide repeat unit polymerase [Pseudomonas entomophila]MDF9617275.1 oligosaccharide repeat unit polymerase [Pseudomonas entomophila]
MLVSPFTLLLVLYFFTNFISLVFGIYDGGMLLEGTFFELGAESLVWAFLLQQLFVLLLWSLYRLHIRRCSRAPLVLGGNYGLFLLAVQLFFMAYNQISGINVAGVESHGSGALNYLFVLVPPDVLFVLIGVGLRSSRWFWLNCLVFLASMFLRGWMGGIFVVVVLILCRSYPIHISMRSFFRGMVGLGFVALLLPVVIEAKWAMRTGVSVSAFMEGLAALSLEGYGEAVRYVMNRLQHVGHVALIMEHASMLHDFYVSGAFIPYWADGLPQMTVYKVLGYDYLRVNTFLVNEIFGYPDAYWNTNPGLAGWAALLQERAVMLFIYVVVLLTFVYAVLGRYGGSRYVLLIGCFSLVYLYHGWVGAFFNLCLYGVFLMVFARLRLLPRYRVRAGSAQ